jgi:eukaryotic-like serine/threonine-protein kinase
MSLGRGSRVRLVDQIGTGGSASVWRAWDPDSRTYVAARLTTADTWDGRVRVRHPHVLTPTAWLDHHGGTLALLPLVRGGTADRLLADHGALPTSYVAILLDQMLDALGALHHAGFVHRDVKPANLLLEPTGRDRPHVWLADLGVATPIGAVTTIAGTTGYLAPEVLPGIAASPGHDLYAAGVSATVLLTGRVPRSVRDLPHGPLRGLLRDLTADDPRARPASAAEARHRIRAPAEADRAGWPEVPDRMLRLTWLGRRRVQGMRAAQ